MADDEVPQWLDSMPADYERALVVPVFEPFAERLAEQVAALQPRRVLELAAGTGVLTRLLVEALPEATVVATDLSDAMVAFGAQQVPGAQWQQADAMSLPFGDGEFDVVTCQFGVMFLPDRVAGFAEAARVIAPGGTLLVNSWGPVEEHTYQLALVQALRRLFPVDPPTFMETVPHGYHDPAVIAADLAAAGLHEVAVEAVEVTSRVESVADLAAGYCTGTPVRFELAGRGDLGRIAAEVGAEMAAILGTPGPLTGRMTAVEARALAG